MQKKRSTLPLLWPALVLYLVADVASSTEGGLDGLAMLLAAIGTGLALVPLASVRAEGEEGRRRVGALGVALGIALVTRSLTGTRSLAVDVAWVLGASTAGALVLDLALTVPDAPARLFSRARRAGVWALALWFAVTGLLSVLPAFAIGGRWVLVSPGLESAPAFFLAAAVAVALALRAVRRRLGSTPETLAASLFAELGLGAAVLVALVLAVAQPAGWVEAGSAAGRALRAGGAVALVLGHGAMIEPHRRAASGAVVRGLVQLSLALAVVFFGATISATLVPHAPIALALVAVATVLAAAGAHALLGPVVRALLAPSSGRLLDATDAAIEALGPATALDDIARVVLPPLRRASGDLMTVPQLFALAPDRCAQVDAAGEPHVAPRALPPALLARLLDQPGLVIARGPIEARAVRRPDERLLKEELVSLDVLAVVPISVRGELEGALVLPRGARRSGLALEETRALERLAEALAPRLAILSAHAREVDRARQATQTQARELERAASAEADVQRLSGELRAVAAGPDSSRFVRPPVAYGEASRALVARLRTLAAEDAPVLLVAPPGSEVVPLAHVLHECGPRAQGPFLVAEVASMPAEDAEVALFGDAAGRPGLLALAGRGTLLVRDVPAVPITVQRALAEALAARQARPRGGTAGYAVEARLVLTSRLPVQALFAAGVLDPALAEWLAPLALEVPRLRDRKEDLESLVLYALDRASRVLGRTSIGIEPRALERLAQSAFPGDVEELFTTIERSVARAAGPKVTELDLPRADDGDAPMPSDPLEGTWDEIERRALVHALDRARGNKSEASRLLGMKRTTFNDRAKKHGLVDGTSVSEPPGEA